MQVRSGVIAASGLTERRARRYPRAIFSVPIGIRMLMPGGVHTTHGISLDISEGGLGALVQNDLKTGDVIEVDLQLPGQELTAVAIVRHSSRVRSGLEFVGLRPEERCRLAAIVASG